jgi:O-methyltransferase
LKPGGMLMDCDPQHGSMKRIINSILGRFGHEIRPVAAGRSQDGIDDLDPEDRRILEKVRPFTMTSTERIVASMLAVRHVVTAGIPGDIVECGVWRGGNMMAMALTLARAGDTDRHLYLYDTFEGMSEPTDADVGVDGQTARKTFATLEPSDAGWCRASIEDVRASLASTGYPSDRLHFVKGRVEDTIPATLPGSIAVLRLDTDWYESTRHEFEHLYPRVSRGGIVMIDDYGHWAGARRAADEYLGRVAPGVFLHRIDYTGRQMVKL